MLNYCKIDLGEDFDLNFTSWNRQIFKLWMFPFSIVNRTYAKNSCIVC